MSWKDRLRPASFRGAPFHVETADRGGGRRLVVHEFPQRDRPYAEDMGLAVRAFTVEGYVVGADYMEARDALLDALEEEGPGELVHPYYGTLRVACGPYRLSESTTEGGMARFSMEFTETEATTPAPLAILDTAGQLADAADAAVDAVGAEFLVVYDPTGLPRALLESAAAVVAAAQASLDGAVAPVLSTAEALSAFRRDADRLLVDVATLVATPAGILGALTGLMDELVVSVMLAGLAVESVLAAYDLLPEIPRPPETTPTRAKERANYDALTRLTQRLVVIQAARLAITETFSSYEDAVAKRDAVVAKLDEQIDIAGDESFTALVALRGALVRGVPGENTSLARLVGHTPQATVPSLVLAHSLYGGVDMEADLVARNRVRRPGFVVGGVPLEVLSSDT